MARTDAQNDEHFVSMDSFKQLLDTLSTQRTEDRHADEAFRIENRAQHNETKATLVTMADHQDKIESKIDTVTGGIIALRWIGAIAVSLATIGGLLLKFIH